MEHIYYIPKSLIGHILQYMYIHVRILDLKVGQWKVFMLAHQNKAQMLQGKN